MRNARRRRGQSCGCHRYGPCRPRSRRSARGESGTGAVTILDDIAAYKHEEISAAKTAKPLRLLMQEARHASPPRGFLAALETAKAEARPGLIAEIKKASPSAGVIRADFDPESIARD